MIRFTGHKSLGTWMYRDAKGVWHVLTPNEVAKDDTIKWKETDGAGEFYWPHSEIGNTLVPMVYDEERAS
jgi:hypothetical protein